ncbi:MAG: hypothetical protein UV92_C0002G0003 [Parcubacteria group bacterium GW2011_GWA1_43_27]|nr:MAG: hypothetical protein UV47_C0015G0003 [Parcubacteria group bacterium GW2011_GWA2_42_80]KKS94146.1 MAG: hypothetical protein UV69_C0001G0035 [Parcubacteria group bacterium GW2011_GWE2_43_12]KKT14281.1 MAG: hypothetical protein UV92_C0002G0003 [Parcubacteria group bacterium GW2011_GWA1_43_27]KKT28279.1 MAG: hypothetical protein UW12_C0004G0003 [Parcubacteria group bacterium GW2011_GWF1_43_9]HBZ36595.1 hypothetical protein [Candidatus Veblenbacteria bacterium]
MTNGISAKETKELEILDNPSVQFTAPATAGLLLPFIMNPNKRRDRVVKLRVKMRMAEEGLDEKTNWQRYYQLIQEEERRFDDRFK